MRVVVVSPGYPPQPGGIEKVVSATSEALVAGGHFVEVWTHVGGHRAVGVERKNGVVVRRFPATRSHRFPISLALARHARTFAADFDVVHIHNYHAFAAACGLLLPRDQPLVFSPHFHGGGHTALARLLHGPYRAIGRRLVARADQLVAVSAAESRLLAEHFPDSFRKMTVIHNGTDASEIIAALPFSDEPPTALVLGRLEAYKNVAQTMQAFAAVGQGQLVVIGDGPDRTRLTALAQSLDAPIRMLGRVSDEDVRRWLRTAQVVVAMSDHEAFGVVALEAAAAGAAVLCSDIEAHAEVAGLAPDRIRLVPRDDTANLTMQIAAALASTKRAQPLATRAWTDVAADFADAYRDVISGA
jgi:glycosyltransferase involved in cell wall biosynthesis